MRQMMIAPIRNFSFGLSDFRIYEPKFVAESWATHSEEFSSFNLVAAANAHHSPKNQSIELHE